MRRTTRIEQIPARRWEGIEPGSRAGRFVATARCRECGRSEEWTAQSMPAPDLVVVKFRQKGWVIRSGKPVCDQCSNTRKERTEMTPTPPVPRPVLKAPTGDKPIPSDAARAQRRLAFMAIEEAYDDTAKRYKPGHSDASIAKAVGCAEGLVATVRNENFGPAVPPEPPEVARLRQEIAALGGSIKMLEADNTDWQRTGMAIAERLREQEAARVSLQERLDRLCSDLCWPG